jgi:hypothetical protein
VGPQRHRGPTGRRPPQLPQCAGGGTRRRLRTRGLPTTAVGRDDGTVSPATSRLSSPTAVGPPAGTRRLPPSGRARARRSTYRGMPPADAAQAPGAGQPLDRAENHTPYRPAPPGPPTPPTDARRSGSPPPQPAAPRPR